MMLRKNSVFLSGFNRLVFVTEKQWLVLDIGTERFIIMPVKVMLGQLIGVRGFVNRLLLSAACHLLL